MILLSAKTVGLVFVALICIGLVAAYGPFRLGYGVYAIDDQYMKAVRNQELLMGFVAFSGILIANWLMKTKIWLAALAGGIAGTLFFTLSQAEDPGFMSYFWPALLEFHSRFLAAGLVAVFLYLGLRKIVGGSNE